MTSEIHNKVEITLEDDTKVTIKPLSIKKLRKFFEAWDKGWSREPNPEKGLSVNEIALSTYAAVSAISLSDQLADKVDKVDQFDNPKELSGLKEEYKEYIEENVDLYNAKKIAEVCGGIVQDDPKILEAALQQMQENGTTT